MAASRLTAAVIDAAAACWVLDRLESAGLVAWLGGGLGVDALLGHPTRPHRDPDLVIARDDRHDLALLARRFGVAVPRALPSAASLSPASCP